MQFKNCNICIEALLSSTSLKLTPLSCFGVLFIIAVPLPPVNLSITPLDLDLFDFNVQLRWIQPLSFQSVIDGYSVAITPLGHPSTTLQAATSILNVTLQYNIDISVTIQSENCVGTSSALSSFIEYRKSPCVIYVTII